jgi:pimeloyl-ACP methyl ester carboxylesterase
MFWTFKSPLKSGGDKERCKFYLFMRWLLDYANNVKLYPAFQEYFRTAKPPVLAIWGKRDLYFIPAGAEAFRRDIPNAIVEFVDTGHFALETHLEEITVAMKQFLAKTAG